MRRNLNKNVIWKPHPGAQEKFLSCPADEVLAHGNRGGGKGLLPDEKILTPTGWTTIKELEEGSIILNPDGSEQTVLKVFHRTEQPMYRVCFLDGTEIKCDEDHLWFAKLESKNILYKQYYFLGLEGAVFKTKYLYDFFYNNPNLTITIPCNKPLEFGSKDIKVDPYLLGGLLASSVYPDIIEKGSLLYKELKKDKGTISVPSIPDKYLYNTLENRKCLLQGLMDIGGRVVGDEVYFSSNSKQLVNDVRLLVFSLGGTVQSVASDYIHTISVRILEQKQLFRVQSKRKECIELDTPLTREIVCIEKLEEKQKTICILVDHPNRLFITRDFLVTHNTDVLLMDFLRGVGVGYGAEWRGILFREEYTQLTDVINKSRKWISQIFPDAKYNGSEHKWTFKTGEVLYLRYMRVPDDYWNYHGHEYSINANSNIQLGNNDLVKASDVQVGDFLQTLEGPKKVTKVLKYTKPGVKVSVLDEDSCLVGTQLQGIMHPVLTNDGWQRIGLSCLCQISQQSLSESPLVKEVFRFLLGVHQEILQISSLSLAYPFLPAISKLFAVQYSCLCQIYRQFVGMLAHSPLKKVFPSYMALEILSLSYQGKYLDTCTAEWIDAYQSILQFAAYCEFLTSLVQYACRLYAHLLASTISCYSGLPSSQVSGSVQLFQYYQTVLGNHYCDCSLSDSHLSILGISQFPFSERSIHAFYPGTSHVYSNPYSYESHETTSLNSSFSFVVSPLETPIEMVDFEVQDAHHYISVLDTPDNTTALQNNFIINQNCWIGWEELTNWATDECYKSMMSCNRSSNPDIPLRIRATCNPAGVGHSWVRSYFIDVAGPYEVYRDPETGRTRVNIPLMLKENKTLLEADPTYVSTIAAAAQDDPVKYKAWVLGEWDIVVGGFFTDLWDKNIHVLPHIQIPSSWHIYRSFDWGSTKPWAVSYLAESNGEQPDIYDCPDGFQIPYFTKGSVIVIREIYGWNGTVNTGDQATSQQIAERVLDMDAAIQREFGCRVFPGPADINIFEVRDGTSIAATMRSFGLHWTKAYKGRGSRIAGWSLMRTMLGSAKRRDPEKPGLYYSEKAVHHIRTIQIMQHDPKNPEDIDSDLEDHCCDSTRYGLTRKLNSMTRRKVGVL